MKGDAMTDDEQLGQMMGQLTAHMEAQHGRVLKLAKQVGELHACLAAIGREAVTARDNCANVHAAEAVDRILARCEEGLAIDA